MTARWQDRHDRPEPTASLPVVRLGPTRRMTALLVLGCAGFVTLCVLVLLSEPNLFQGIVAIAGIVFFGLGGVYMLVRLRGGRAVLTVTPEGLRPGFGGFVPWADVAEIGVTRTSSATVVGIRLGSSDAYVASLTAAERAPAQRFAVFARLFGIATGSRKLAGMPLAGIAEQLDWARQHSGGFDLTFSPLTLGRKPAAVVALLERYREEA